MHAVHPSWAGQTRDSLPGRVIVMSSVHHFPQRFLTPPSPSSWLRRCSHKWGKWRAGVRDRVTRRFNLLLPPERVWQLAADILFKLTPALKYRSQRSVFTSRHILYLASFPGSAPGGESQVLSSGEAGSWLLKTQFSVLSPPGAQEHLLASHRA